VNTACGSSSWAVVKPADLFPLVVVVVCQHADKLLFSFSANVADVAFKFIIWHNVDSYVVPQVFRASFPFGVQVSVWTIQISVISFLELKKILLLSLISSGIKNTSLEKKY